MPEDPLHQDDPLTKSTRVKKGFADDVLSRLNPTGEPEDEVIEAIGEEIDRLEELLDGKFLKASAKVNASARRASILSSLYNLIKDRKAVQEQKGAVQIVARMIRHLQDVLQEMKLPTEVRQTVINNVLEKIDKEEEEAKAARSRKA